MISIRTFTARGARRTLSTKPQNSRSTSTSQFKPHTFVLLSKRPSSPFSPNPSSCPITILTHQIRTFASPPSSPSPSPSANELLETLQDQYATAKDEFEIASEETEKKSVYAEEDRKAAREEYEKLKGMYEEAVKGEHGEEVRRRVGGRVRELEQGVVEMERRGLED